jgi:hypothetical protein
VRNILYLGRETRHALAARQFVRKHHGIRGVAEEINITSEAFAAADLNGDGKLSGGQS